ncbi:DNA-processing protein DprA [Halopseudomonas nanhaiensis]|uniref:DNA-processing protein DprA n=1 Tax=Halopseudomonas nanhaiensis TaxID=2830842 RepID=UPI001CBF95DC|nr:DNA-processing protein DprA [Halopseudomonas nanhaiensis]UAW98430.1 DNA-processing protein DprA [Halopseudomonas nanhaiensis]
MSTLSGTRQAWLALSMLDGLGPKGVRQLLETLASPVDLLNLDLTRLRSLGLQGRVVASVLRYRQGDAELQARIDASIAWAEQPGNHLLWLEHPAYPPLLREITDPPLVLYVRGNPEVLSDPQLAMVGTRHPGPHGAATAHDFARCFTEQGLVVTSGMALGIDGACHQGALAAGGPTVAVWGTGLQRCYPHRHRQLAEAIVERGGALVSEMPPDAGPQPGQFPRRNRIISGLSLGTLVVEASLNSGSLITARLALEQNREVFAMPGSIHNTQARGCNKLLREGAHLVETVADVLSVLRVPLRQALDAQPTETAEPRHPLLRWLGYDPLSADRLSMQSGMPVQQVLQGLLELELDGLVQQTAHGYTRVRA